VSALWIGLVVAALLVIALLIFIAQNSKQVAIHYLGFNGHISLAVALLRAAVGAVLLVAIPGTARIIQLRRALTKNAVTTRATRPRRVRRRLLPRAPARPGKLREGRRGRGPGLRLCGVAVRAEPDHLPRRARPRR